jgi:hypothetical protein
MAPDCATGWRSSRPRCGPGTRATIRSGSGAWATRRTVCSSIHLRRPFGDLAPVTFDVEWYADGAAEAIPMGYQQAGEVDARIELTEGVFELEGPAHRVHVWGVPYLPSTLAIPTGDDLAWAPYRRHDGRGVLQVLTRGGWLARTVDLP